MGGNGPYGCLKNVRLVLATMASLGIPNESFSSC